MNTTKLSLSRFLMCVLLITTLIGCSSIEFGYRNADWLLQRWVDDLLDPDYEQSERWEAVFEREMLVHQRQLLPPVIDLLTLTEHIISNKSSNSSLNCWADELQALLKSHAEWAVGPASQMLNELSPEQLDHLQYELQERNQERRDELLSPDPVENHQKRVERYQERVQRWIGRLSAEQQAIIERTVSQTPHLSEPWLAYRSERQQQLLTLLRSSADTQRIQRYLTSWWVSLEGRDPQLIADQDTLHGALLDMAQQLDISLSQQQRDDFLAEVAQIKEGLMSIPEHRPNYRDAHSMLAGCSASVHHTSR